MAMQQPNCQFKVLLDEFVGSNPVADTMRCIAADQGSHAFMCRRTLFICLSTCGCGQFLPFR